MGGDITLVGVLVAGITAVSGAVGVLFREMRKDNQAHYASITATTQAHLQVTSEQTKVLTLMQEDLRGVRSDVDVLTTARTEQLNRIERDAALHASRTAMEHEAVLRQLPKGEDAGKYLGRPK